MSWVQKILFLFGLIACGSARAGTADVGGGTGNVCRDSQSQLKSVELLDLLEGVHRHHFVIPDSDVESALQAERLLDRLQFGYRNHEFETASPASYLLHVQKIASDMPAGFGLQSPSDLGKEQAVYVREGCKLELIGQREKVGPRTQLSIVPALFSALSGTQQAAFWVHEAIYSFYQSYFQTRVSDDVGTAQIRKLVAALFASNTTLEDIVEASRFLFVLDKGKVYVVASRQGAVVELEGRTDEFERELDKLGPGDARKFSCPGVKSLFRAGRLVLEGDGTCYSQIKVEGLKARLLVNGKEVMEISRDQKLELDFLRDHKDFSELRGIARYPFAGAASKQRKIE